MNITVVLVVITWTKWIELGWTDFLKKFINSFIYTFMIIIFIKQDIKKKKDLSLKLHKLTTTKFNPKKIT